MSKIKTNIYFDDFILYYDKAKRVQKDCNLGGKSYLGSCGDDLIENVTIYDTVERKHAGFQNFLQDLWFGTSAPKYYKLSEEKKEKNKFYDNLHERLGRREWLYIFLTHRITGSGASFESDHGYRNSILHKLVEDNIHHVGHMLTAIRFHESVMYTSIGNQIPAFPKPKLGYSTGGKLYFGQYSIPIVDSIWKFIDKVNDAGRKVNIRELVDFMCEWNRSNGIKRFHFQYTAVAADLADYYPNLVDETSHMYYGKNAKEAMDLFAEKVGKVSKAEYYDLVMESAKSKTGGHPKDLEDVMCDYIRYVENYVPDNKQKTYSHIDRKKIWNNSLIVDHPKGRQKWKLNTDSWEW
jgi:hypothetical protein